MRKFVDLMTSVTPAPVGSRDGFLTFARERRKSLSFLLLFAGLLLAVALFLAAQSAVAQVTVDYDLDDDGLIEVGSWTQLDAIRWDLNGDGTVDDSSNETKYQAAFPDAASGMGCPTEDGATCTGYELMADLNFDPNGNGPDPSDPFYDAGAGWQPIGDGATGFTGNFNGNGNTISNLFISRNETNLGLFGALRHGGGRRGNVTGVHMADVSVTGAGLAQDGVGGLVGKSIGGRVIASSMSGSVSASGDGASVGGLVGLTMER